MGIFTDFCDSRSDISFQDVFYCDGVLSSSVYVQSLRVTINALVTLSRTKHPVFHPGLCIYGDLHGFVDVHSVCPREQC